MVRTLDFKKLIKTAVLMPGCLILLLGCGESVGPSPDSSTGPRFLKDQRIDIANEPRNFHLYLPNNPANASILFLLHGNGGSSDQILGEDGTKAPFKVWMDVAPRENIILVVPDGSVGPNDKQGWNDCRTDAPTNPDSDDVLFIRTLLEQIIETYSTGEPRVFAAGISNGGLMIMRLSDEIPEKFNAVAIVVASKPVNTECVEASDPLPVLFMKGTDDPILPYDGGQIGSDRGEVFSTNETISYWVNRNQTALTPTETLIADVDQSDDSLVRRYSYPDGINGTTVEHYEVSNGGHTEPSIQERYGLLYKLLVGNQNGDLEMAEEIWNFFEAF